MRSLPQAWRSLLAACADSDGEQAGPDTTSGATAPSSTTTEAATTTEVAHDDLDACRQWSCRRTRSPSGLRRAIPTSAAWCCGLVLHPDPLTGGGMPDEDLDVTWEISPTPEFDTVASNGIATATAAHAHTVHAVVPLDQGTWYYRFRVGQYTSPVGATRAAPGRQRRSRPGDLRRRQLSELRGRSICGPPRPGRARARLRGVPRGLHLRVTGCRRNHRPQRARRISVRSRRRSTTIETAMPGTSPTRTFKPRTEPARGS